MVLEVSESRIPPDESNMKEKKWLAVTEKDLLER